MSLLISSNQNYIMHEVKSIDKDFSFLAKDTLKTIFLHDGNLEVKIVSKKGVFNLNLKDNQGLILLPHVEFVIQNNNSNFFSVQSKVTDLPFVEIADKDGIRFENNIDEFKLIDKPKKVVKPWGHEIWISWFKNYHVLKRIFMIKGNKCSLQYHEKKSETNFIVNGKANVLKGINLKKNISEKDALTEYNNINNVNDYMSTMGPNDHWDNQPFEIHRVFSIESYTAYEASTAELDDVIRLQDDNNRVSGFIQSEHE